MATAKRKGTQLDWPNPCSLESEEAVVGVVLMNDARNLPTVRAQLVPEDFHTDHCRSVFRAMCEMEDRKTPIDLVTVVQHLDGTSVSASDVARLTDTSATSVTLGHHIDIVRRYSDARKVYRFGITWARRAASSPTSELIEEVAAASRALASRSGKALSMEDMREIHEEWLESDNKPIFTTGIEAIDRYIKCQADYLWVIGARPKTGKTSLAIDLSARISGTGQGGGLFYSLEMSADRIMRKYNARLCPHSAWLRRARGEDGLLTIPELLREHTEPLYKLPVRIIDTQSTIEGICASARHEVQQDPDIKYIVIDYMELIRTREKITNKVDRLDHALLALVALKKELKRPIFLISQLRRRDKNGPEEPGDDELKGSGMIEQSADAIVLLWNGTLTDAERRLSEGVYRKVKAKIIQRDGPCGIVSLEYYPPQSKFGNWKFGGMPMEV